MIVEVAERIREEVHGVSEHRFQSLAGAGRLGPKLRRREQPQVDVMSGVVADVHPGAIELEFPCLNMRSYP